MLIYYELHSYYIYTSTIRCCKQRLPYTEYSALNLLSINYTHDKLQDQLSMNRFLDNNYFNFNTPFPLSQLSFSQPPQGLQKCSQSY